MTDQRHPYAGHPAALVLADHREVTTARGAGGDRKVRCTCDGWAGRDYDHAAHQTEVLHRAGLLAPRDVVDTLLRAMASVDKPDVPE